VTGILDDDEVLSLTYLIYWSDLLYAVQFMTPCFNLS
jgi:hypothetical protein